MMFGYATNESDNYMPLTLDIAHKLLQELAAIRKEGKQMKYLRPDLKSQVTLEYADNNTPLRIDTIVVSTQHDDFAAEAKMLAKINKDVKKILIPKVKKQLPKRIQKLFNKDITYYINPTGKFVMKNKSKHSFRFLRKLRKIEKYETNIGKTSIDSRKGGISGLHWFNEWIIKRMSTSFG